MFEAYSSKEKRVVNVKEQFDANEIFLCPDPDCKAEMKLKSINGKVAKHFASTGDLKKHSLDCIYQTPKSYKTGPNLIKVSPENILNSIKSPNENKAQQRTPHSKNPSKTSYIRTPKQLLNFCLLNDLSTIYCDNQTVNNIIVDSRNVGQGLFKGFNGIRLVVGKTIKYSMDDSSNFILFSVNDRTSNRKLTAKVYLSTPLIQKAIKHYMDTYDKKFSGHNIAVLGDWKKDSEYHISCVVSRDRNLIIHF